MTKLLLDPTIFNLQEYGGISRYYTEIYSALENEENVAITCPLLYTENIHFKESLLFQNSFQYRNRFLIKYSKIFRRYLPRKLKRKTIPKTIALLEQQKFDIFIPTYYFPYFLKHLNGKPYVLTVYDMIHELYPHYFDYDKDTVPNKKLLIENATKIIAISQSTKNDIIKFYPHISPAKIEVVYLAHTIKTQVEVNLVLPEKYILFVGNRLNYKNFLFFLNAAAPLLAADKNLVILCAGGNPFNEEEAILIAELGCEQQVLQENFKDAELSTYYKQALCFVFPSEYEGFGIPVLEAMACGCPVVLANHSSFPEVAGDAGIYFELNNEADLRDKILFLINSSENRNIYRNKGSLQAGKFDWKKTTEECLKVYHSIV